ncbi:hypothetical protein L1280_002906 [Deinococcus sp. HSC-46F16]|uniref:hypothetical protein n=1 Tax=Deinococcus sp. HSC-46F16 TaxID=2910968 RepID=UPI00209EF236|nr:hypothetical protein [Deinococcus sp. HSC-46F16]MCP2015730.1 hypothetical protein [Deinococcus sp. HSC-46F16]
MVSRLRAVPVHVRLSWLLPLAFVLAALALAVTSPDEPRARFAHLALVDATLSTALVVLLLTPVAQRNWHAFLGVGLRGVALTALVFPEVRAYLWLDLMGLAVGGVLVGRGWRLPLPEGYSELDDLERLYALCGRLSRTPRLTRLPLYDLLLFRHLFVRPRLPEGQHFGTRRGATTGATLTLLVFGSAVEGLLAHVLLERWNPTAAWVWTGLNVAGLLWLLAYGRALATRPVTVGRRRLYLRSGLHWTGSTALANLEEAAPYGAGEDADALCIAIDVRPNVTLRFTEPVRLYGVYLTEREVRQVTLHLDDPAAFLRALNR